MSKTVKGGDSFRQRAAQRGRDLIRQDRKRKEGFESLREKGNKPSLKLGPLLNDIERS